MSALRASLIAIVAITIFALSFAATEAASAASAPPEMPSQAEIDRDPYVSVFDKFVAEQLPGKPTPITSGGGLPPDLSSTGYFHDEFVGWTGSVTPLDTDPNSAGTEELIVQRDGEDPIHFTWNGTTYTASTPTGTLYLHAAGGDFYGFWYELSASPTPTGNPNVGLAYIGNSWTADWGKDGFIS